MPHIYFVQMNIPEALDAELNRIYDTEHVPMLSKVPGISRGALPMIWLREFPASGVAFQVWSVAVASAAAPRFGAELPLQLTRFSVVPRFVGGGEPIPLFQVFYGDGRQFTAAVWIGRQASPASKHAIWSAVRSVRFPSAPGRRSIRPPSEYAASSSIALR